MDRLLEILMPCADTGVEECTLLRWLVGPGDPVAPGDDIAVVRVANNRRFDVRLYEEGRVGKLLVAEGATVAVGTPILELVREGKKGAWTHPQVNLVERYMGEPVVDEGS